MGTVLSAGKMGKKRTMGDHASSFCSQNNHGLDLKKAQV